MSANRGKFVSSIAALRPTDAPATPGRSVAVFFGAGFVSWALSALRGLFPSRGRALCGQSGRNGGGGNVCKSRNVCQQYRGFATGTDAPATTGRSADGFEGVLRRGLCLRSGTCPHRGGGAFSWRRAKRGGALAKRAERLGTGLFAWRRAATVTTFG